jgi:hypothetical protein
MTLSNPLVDILSDTSNVAHAKPAMSAIPTSIPLIAIAKFNVRNSSIDHLCLPTDIVWTGSHIIIRTVPGSVLYNVSTSGIEISLFMIGDRRLKNEFSVHFLNGTQSNASFRLMRFIE